MDPSSAQNQLYYTRMKEQLSQIGFPAEDFESSDPEAIARNYLSECGMSEEEIERLKAALEGNRN